MSVTLQSRFRGCLIGLAVGDALGGRFEAQTADYIVGRFGTATRLVEYVTDEIWYTDDTQMAIGVAETIAKHGRITEQQLCEAFVENYDPSRGYGMGARAVLGAMENGRNYRAVAEKRFPGGSYGNGAAMRVAPVGLFFRHDTDMLIQQSRLSAIPTHVHPLGINGAQLIALAVGYVSKIEAFERAVFFFIT